MDLWRLLVTIAALVTSFLPQGPWTQTLNDLDDRRNHAFVSGDGGALRRVYAVGSTLLETDRKAIRAYGRRDLEVDRVSIRLLRVDVLATSTRRVRLQVVDQLEPVRVRTPGGAWRSLPRDEPTERTIVLVRAGRGWRIAAAIRTAG